MAGNQPSPLRLVSLNSALALFDSKFIHILWKLLNLEIEAC